jgi:hypothetical protein
VKLEVEVRLGFKHKFTKLYSESNKYVWSVVPVAGFSITGMKPQSKPRESKLRLLPAGATANEN